MSLESLRAKYTDAGQGHVFDFVDKLSETEKESLAQQLSAIDPVAINAIVAKAKRWEVPEANVEPLPTSSQASVINGTNSDSQKWEKAGLDAIKQGKVAVIVLAGGQGTRLGSSAPKGCYDIGLPSHKSLFQLQAERIKKLGSCPWYVLTSGPTREPTEKFFAEHKYFGLNPENVVFFEQGVLPCLTNDDKIILETPSKVSVSPDGNGGVYKALQTGGILVDMKKRGIQHVHMYCVDNPLVKVADPVFIGFSALRNVDVATKVVRKREADEQVGLIACRGNHPAVIEYSEISPALREATDPEHPELLKLRAANIVNHYYSFEFLERTPELARDAMPFHIAHKKISYAAKDGQTVKPEKPNGIKLEQFVFDIFSEVPMDKFASLEVLRSSEFSPVKNAPGTPQDSSDSARADVLDEGRRWLLAAGAKSSGPVEVSPLVSYNGEGLGDYSGKEVKINYIHK